MQINARPTLLRSGARGTGACGRRNILITHATHVLSGGRSRVNDRRASCDHLPRGSDAGVPHCTTRLWPDGTPVGSPHPHTHTEAGRVPPGENPVPTGPVVWAQVRRARGVGWRAGSHCAAPRTVQREHGQSPLRHPTTTTTTTGHTNGWYAVRTAARRVPAHVPESDAHGGWGGGQVLTVPPHTHDIGLIAWKNKGMALVSHA